MSLDKARDKVEEVAGLAEQTYGETTDSHSHCVRGAARRYASKASYAARDVTDSVRDQVQNNPLAGLAVAAGIGVIFGYLLNRK